MSKKKKSNKNINTNAGKKLTTCLIIGIICGLVLGTIFLFIQSDIFYFGVSPIVGAIIGMIVGSILENKEYEKTSQVKKINKSKSK